MPTLRHHWPFPWLDNMEARRNGKIDGKVERPKSSQPCQYVDGELKRVTGDVMSRIGLAWTKRLGQIQSELTSNEEIARQSRLKAATAQNQMNELCAQYESLYKEQFMIAGLRNPWNSYRLLMFVLFIIELPMNAVVFRTFQESEVLTLVFTLGLSFLMLTGAHALGHFMKEESTDAVREGDKSKAIRKFAIGLLLFIPLPIIIGIAYYRHTYLQQVTGSKGGAFDMTSLFFFALNLFFYAIATIFSYNTTNPLRDQILRANRTLKTAQAAGANAEARQKVLREMRKRQFDSYRAGALQITERAGRLVGIYRKHNERSRADIFNWPPEPEWTLPDDLATAKWEESK